MDDLRELKHETAYCRYHLKDGILLYELKPDLIIDLTIARRIEDERIALVEHDHYPCALLIPKEHLLFEKEAFEFLTSDAACMACAAKAVVIQSTLRKLLTNFKMSLNSNKVPLRIFTSKSNARLWLFEFVKEDLMGRTDWLHDDSVTS